jgi:nucleoside phosphorylase
VLDSFALGRPVFGTDFFGRQPLILDVLAHLQRGSAVNVYGLRRIGKSSLLQQISYLCGFDPEWGRYRPISIDGAAVDPDNLILFLAQELGIHLETSRDPGAYFLVRDKLRKTIGKPLLLLDEAGGPISNADSSTLGMIRALHQEGACGLIFFTAYQRIYEILRKSEDRLYASSLGNVFVSIRLPVFQAHEAEELLVTHFQRGSRLLDPELANKLSRYVGAYPQFVQEIGSTAFQYCVQNNLSGLGTAHFGEVTDIWRKRIAPWWADMFLHGLDELAKDSALGSSDDRFIESLLDYGMVCHTENGSLQPSPFIADLVETDPGRSVKTAIAKALSTTEKSPPVLRARTVPNQEKIPVGTPQKADEFHGTVDFGVLTVREDEMEPMARRCRERAVRQVIVTGRQDYLLFDVSLGTTHEFIYRLALARSIRQGAGEAQRRASNMIEDFDPTWLMLVGIAGATPSTEFTLGDVVVATDLHEFSVRAAVFGKGTEYRPGGGAMAPEVEDFIALLAGRQDDLSDWNEVPVIGRRSPPVDIRRPKAVYGDKRWRTKVRAAISSHFPTPESTRKPQIITRPFAGGNVLIKDDGLWQEWQSHARQIETVEMELEGVYRAAWTRHRIYPILVSKGISDIIGLRRDDAWTKYACETAASGALAMLALRPTEPIRRDRH